jgi:hypothetical protein
MVAAKILAIKDGISTHQPACLVAPAASLANLPYQPVCLVLHQLLALALFEVDF